MSTLAEVTDRIRREHGVAGAQSQPATPAPRTIVLEQSELAHSWEERPAGSICLGLCVPSVAEKEAIVKEALNQVLKNDTITDNEAAQAEFEKAKVVLYVSRSIRDPNDVKKAHPLFRAPDLQIPRCLTERALLRVFDECEKLAVESSPISPEASDEEVELLCLSLNGESLRELEPHREARARRWIWFLLEELKGQT